MGNKNSHTSDIKHHTKTVQYVVCSHLYHRSTQTCSNFSHFPSAADAKDAVPCSNGLLVGRKNIRNLVFKDLERFQGLFGVNWLMPYKTQNYEYTILLWFHIHLFSLSLLHFILPSALLHWRLQFSPELSSQNASSIITISSLVNMISL